MLRGDRQAMQIGSLKSGLPAILEVCRMSRSASAANAVTAALWLDNGSSKSRDGAFDFGG